MRSAFATKDAALIAATAWTLADGQARGVWWIRADGGCGWRVPARYIVGKLSSGAPMMGAPLVARIEGAK